MADQKPTAKRRPVQKSTLDEWRGRALGFKEKVIAQASNWERFKNIIGNNYDLGREHLERGNIQDALFRFKFVVWLDPKYKDSWYYLGLSHLAAGTTKAAREAFSREIKLHPQNEAARYMLAITTGKSMPKAELPKSIPQQLLTDQFDNLAPTFTKEQVGAFKYEGHIQITNAVRSAITPGRIDHVVLELGCGTGLCGPLMRDIAGHLTGVDISAAMLAEAVKINDERGRKVYDALIRREAVEFMVDGPDESYDIVVAAGLVSYIGELQPLYEQAARLLKAGGVLAFTADPFDGTGFQFDPESGRFRHSLYYLNDLAARFGLSEFRCREASIYPEAAGLLCVYRK